MIKIRVSFALISIFCLIALAPSSAFSDNLIIDFDNYNLGTVNGQQGWSSLGAAGSGCGLYDHLIFDNSLGEGAPSSFGSKSLRISNAVTSGCFSDQTFSKSLTFEAGETNAENGNLSTGPRQNYFEFEVSFASALPEAEQAGLSVVLSPDRGDGARMSWVGITDSASGLGVGFYDYSASNFRFTQVATGLDRVASHTIRLTMQFVDGSNNDIVKVYIDGVLKHTGTSWEGYFTEQEINPTRTVDSVLFRTGGPTPVPSLSGKGLLFDNLRLLSGLSPLTQESCFGNNWQTFTYPRVFKNQGQCVASIVSNSTNH